MSGRWVCSSKEDEIFLLFWSSQYNLEKVFMQTKKRSFKVVMHPINGNGTDFLSDQRIGKGSF